MLSGAVTNRYTEGLYRAARAQHKVAKVDDGLRLIADVLEQNSELEGILQHPVISPQQKAGVIQSVFGEDLDPLLTRFLRLLFERGRSAYIGAIARRFHELAEEAEGRVRVRIETAMPIPEPRLRALEDALSQRLQKQVRADIAIVPDLIAGIRIHVGHRVLDATVKGALDQFAERLGRVASAQRKAEAE
ncbi:MAG: ATP synthase F1 subunit delta [Thermoflavifilum sp.]|nr:ATP synthase F1 subunit delta [Thermoflavifilum sp.]MCL6513190.1 ATP synthase F1 subunit delta [Alicyclobacillus sp.]